MSYAPIVSEPSIKNLKAHRSLRPRDYSSKSKISSKRPSQKTQKLEPAQKDGASKPTSNESLSWPIIVHCHLAWDWVWQRPQQFISRLSRRHRILFVETLLPLHDLAAPSARFRTPSWTSGPGAFSSATRPRSSGSPPRRPPGMSATRP